MLRIIQISDLHLDKDTDLDNCIKIVGRFNEAIKSKVDKDDKLIICTCGDILNKADTDGFLKAKEIFNYIREQLKNYDISFEFVPGNHELNEEKREFSGFDNFIKEYTDNQYSYDNMNIINRKYDELNIMLVNSVFHKDKNYGCIDRDRIASELKHIDSNVILVMHHTMISEYQGDQSQIRDSYKLLRDLAGKNIVGLLHGHTHGYSNIKLLEECKVVGVGPFLKKQEDINLQFNMINIVADKIDEVHNFRYSQDINSYTGSLVYKREDINYFKGKELKSIYKEILKGTKEYGIINNFNMNLNTDLSSFIESVEIIFKDSIDIAQSWQLKESPNTLYYNHGEYMHTKENNSIDYVIDELKRKATSSRAIIPLLRLEDVLKGGDSFLPSLDSIQFGFTNEERNELCITIYMRALEVKNFLPVNICEVYLMVKQIQHEIRSIKKININIFAFRAQYKEKFGCFKKADIDMLKSYDIMKYTMKKDTSTIIRWLENKLDLSETIIHLDGLIHLDESISRDDDDFYTEELKVSLKNLIRSMDGLRILREKTSNYDEIKKEEVVVECNIKDVISKFKEIEV